MLETQGLHFEALAPEVGLHIAIHPKFVRVAEGVAGTYGWVMADLFREILKVGRQELEGLS